jgi:hypothetical protein
MFLMCVSICKTGWVMSYWRLGGGNDWGILGDVVVYILSLGCVCRVCFFYVYDVNMV